MASDIERRQLVEDQYVLNFELAPKVRQRRNVLLAEWLSAQNRRNMPAYVENILKIGSEESSDAEFCRRVLGELVSMPSDVGEQQLREQMRSLLHLAAEQLARESENLPDKT